MNVVMGEYNVFKKKQMFIFFNTNSVFELAHALMFNLILLFLSSELASVVALEALQHEKSIRYEKANML